MCDRNYYYNKKHCWRLQVKNGYLKWAFVYPTWVTITLISRPDKYILKNPKQTKTKKPTGQDF